MGAMGFMGLRPMGTIGFMGLGSGEFWIGLLRLPTRIFGVFGMRRVPCQVSCSFWFFRVLGLDFMFPVRQG